MSFARGVTFWPGLTAIWIDTESRRLDPSARSVSSTITTASAPSGTGAPVAISAHSPAASGRRGASPVKMTSTERRVFGDVPVAPSVSAARTAKPSIAARANGGTSAPAAIVSASTRPPASASATRSVRSMGVAAASVSSSASRKGIVVLIGRTADRTRATCNVLCATCAERATCCVLVPRAAATCSCYRFSSRTTWPISGRMSFSMASRTAFSDPGSVNTIVFRIVPAHARLSIAAAPICW